MFGEARVRGWLAGHGSPLYVYDLDDIRERYRTFASAFSYPHTEFHYAIVCNKNPLIVAALGRLGAHIHANTPGDAFCAMAAGIAPSRIVYSGTNLNHEDMAFLLSNGIALNVDSVDQLSAIAALRGKTNPTTDVGLRLFVTGGAARIGVARAELGAAVRIAGAGGIRVTRLHMYVGTNTRRVESFVNCLNELVSAAETLPELESIDIGGGYGIAYDKSERELDVMALGRFASEAALELSQRVGRTIRLLVEPGRILVGPAGSLYVTVVSVKERGGRRYVGVDSTVGNLVVPSVYHMHHRIRPISVRGETLEVPTDICGNTTHSRDFLGRDLKLPSLAIGDTLCISDVGAYGYAMSSHFLNRPRPPELVVDGDREILATRRETFEDLMRTHNLDAALLAASRLDPRQAGVR